METKHVFLRTQTAVAIGMMGFLAFSARGQSPQSSSTVNFVKTAGAGVEEGRRRTKHGTIELSGKLPMSFEPNVGQLAPEVSFVSHGGGYDLFLTKQEAVLALVEPEQTQTRSAHIPIYELKRGEFLYSRKKRLSTPTSVLRLSFPGANPSPIISGTNELPGKSNYFIGNDPTKWRTGVPTYSRVEYRGLYPGVNLIFHGSKQRLEYDLVVAPQADDKQVAFTLTGASNVRLDAEGNLEVGLSGRVVELRKPLIYQETNGSFSPVKGHYVIAGRNTIKLRIGRYDHGQALVIDPVVDYSTYLGGSSDDNTYGVAVDANGDVFVSSQTSSTDFPITSGAVQTTNQTSAPWGTGAVTEINPTGTSVLYSTYLGGSGGEGPFALAVDSASPPNVYVAGFTCSNNFPTTSNAYQPMFTPAHCNGSTGAAGFVTKFNPALNGIGALEYSTYLGGNLGDMVEDMAIDEGGNIYVTGWTESSNYPTTSGAFQTVNHDSGSTIYNKNAFISRIDPTKSGTASLVYSSYLGGSGKASYGDQATGIAVDSSQNVYITGNTGSFDFPVTATAFMQTAPAGMSTNGTAFLARIDTSATGPASLVYSTYLGGNGGEGGDDVSLGPGNIAYIAGWTYSPNFPVTTGAYLTTAPSTVSTNGIGMLSSVDTSQSGAASLVYSTFFGGSNGDLVYSIKVDPAGNAYLGGATYSMDFPATPGAFQTSLTGCGSGFVAELMPAGNGSADLIYATYYDGTEASSVCTDTSIGVSNVALDSTFNVYVTGITSATDFPVIPNNAYQTVLKGSSDGYVAKLTMPTSPASTNPQAGGQRPVVAPSAVELGFTETSSGNLHLEIPLGSFPQRGAAQSLGYSLVYDSFMWIVNPSTNRWQPGVPYAGSFGQWWSWRLGSQDSNNPPHWSIQTQDPACGNVPEYLGFFWADNSGSAHFFPIKTYTCSTNALSSGDAFALDASGYHMYVTNFTNAVVYAPDGTLVAQTTPRSDSRGAYINWEDSNGNYLSSNNTGTIQYDTLGREVAVTAFCERNVRCYEVLNSQGQYSTYKATYVTIPVKSKFGQSGVSECTSNCTVSVIASLTLPDSTSYGFKYDCDSSSGIAACGSPSGQAAYYGELTSLTFPTGGQVSYSYTNFTDSYGGKGRWLNQRTSASSVWTYTPQVIRTCSQGTVGCQQQVTVTKPSGDYSVTTFTINGGAWPVQTQLFSSGGTLLSSATTTWDFSQPCPTGFSFYCTNGSAAYVRKIADTLTVPVAGGTTITKQTAYSYDSPQTGNIISVKEWGYYSGSSPSFPSVPDRATYLSYLTTGTNDINRPLKVTVCNNAGSDTTNCPGGGSRVSQTLNTYDSYSSCPSGLKSVTGISNHDDTNFGATYTQRGNATQAQSWVSGSTYLTTQLCYDSTQQIYQSSDPLGNPTTYDYTDNFFTETGAASMSSFSPSTPTNAYPKTITTGGLRTTFGYYFGSGKQAFTTDPNNQTTSYFLSDPLDRPTLTQYPIGWNLTNYTSATQGDSFAPVADTGATTSCTSCRHTQVNLDAWGRKVNEKLVNAPGGAISVDTVYDSSGRVQSVSHSYVNTSDPSHVFETFGYDALDRRTSVTHPDNQSSQILYGPLVSAAGVGGLSAQQGSPSIYGYGYPVLTEDETGIKKRQEWIDGFGRIIEVDEPATGKTPGTGTVTVEGGEQSTIYYPCGVSSCPTVLYNSGTVSVTVTAVNGITATASYGQNDTSSTVASNLANSLNSPNSPVTATLSGSTITLVSKALGGSTNYSLSTTSTTSYPQYFSGPSFWASMSGSTLTGGSDTGSSFSPPSVTLYTYDALDNLTQVVQGVQARAFTYDGLGRRTSMTTPEAGTDSFYFTQSGSVSLCAGSPKAVCRKTDARGITSTYTYDSLNRLTGKSYSNGQGSVTYTYDQGGAGAFALGRLTNITEPSGSETYTYNQIGRITKFKKTIGGTTFTIRYQYNAGGQLTQITYPSNRLVNQNVDNIGLLNTIVSGSRTYASIPEPPTGYNAAGQLLTFTYANGVVANFGYSSATRDQMTSLSYAKGGTTLFSLNYGYMNGQANCGTNTTTGNDGLIQCIQDNVDNGRSVVYGYDALNRLMSAVTAGSSGYGKWGLSWAYDRYGNRLSQTVTAGTGPSNSLSFATTPAPPANPPGGAYTNRPDGYLFDASGNMQNDGDNTLTYDGENCLTSSANSGTGTTVYTCDVHGIRVKKALQGGTTTAYVFSGGKDIAEYDYISGAPSPGSPSREYIYLGGQLIATIQSTSTIYHHADHLSVRVTTDANGNKIGEESHYPYGEQWYATNTTTKFFFTSYERDAESGNDYAMARFYINRFGRFSCVDPSLGSLADPQSWNRYAYARNNPVNITDPSGQFWLFKLIGALLAVIGSLISFVQPGAGVWLINLGLAIAGAGFVPNIPGTSPGTPPTFPDPLGNTQATLNSIYHPIDPSKFGTPPFFDPATGSLTDALQQQLKDALNGLAGRCKSVLPYGKMQDTVEKLQFYDARPKSFDSGLYADYVQPGAVHKTLGDLMSSPGTAALVLPYRDKGGNLQRSPNILIGKAWGIGDASLNNAVLVHEETHYVMQLDDNQLWAFAQKNGANAKQGGKDPSAEYTWWIQRGCPDEQGGGPK